MTLVTLTLLWVPLLLVFYVVRGARKIEGAGLITAYLVSFCGLHWSGGLIRLLPWFRGPNPLFTTYGLEQSIYALAAFIAGSLFLSPLLTPYLSGGRADVRYMPHPRLPQAYLWIGIVSFVLLSALLGGLPSMGVVIAAGEELYIVGICLFCWQAHQRKQPSGLLKGLAMTLVMPLITTVMQGFMGYGAAAAIVVFAFVGSFFSRRKMLVATVLTAYVGLSVYVTYMRDRKDIRVAVWGGQSLENRLDMVAQATSTFEWFDPYNSAHLSRIESRLNQNFLVGAAVYHLSETHNFAHGETLWDAILALVPRVIWPEKTVFGGSGDLVSRYTGISFAQGTSVGVGQVLEFYLNFGTMGVVLGYLIFGAAITTVDVATQRRLIIGDHQGFTVWFMTGISLLQPGGSLVEISASIAGSLITVKLVNRYLIPHLQKKSFLPAAPRPSVAAARLGA